MSETAVLLSFLGDVVSAILLSSSLVLWAECQGAQVEVLNHLFVGYAAARIISSKELAKA